MTIRPRRAGRSGAGCGARIAEFPETLEAAEAARAGGDGIVMGAPNVVRGGEPQGQRRGRWS